MSAWLAVVEVVERVHDALDEPWPVERLALTAGYEPSHFSALFVDIVGDTPGRYVRRLRLERAAHQLDTQPGRSVLDVAVDAGFDSADGFTRAFRRAFGVTPTALRRAGAPVRGPAEKPDALTIDGVVRRGLSGLAVPAAPDPAALGAALNVLGAAGAPPYAAGMLAWPWGWYGVSEPSFRAFVFDAPVVGPPGWPLRVRPRRWLRARWFGAPWEAHVGIFWLHEGGAARLGHRVGFAPTLTTFADAGAQRGPIDVWLPLAEG